MRCTEQEERTRWLSAPIPEGLLSQLTALAKRHNVSRSSLVRRAVSREVESILQRERAMEDGLLWDRE